MIAENAGIRQEIKDVGLRQRDIALKLGMLESGFSKLLRKKLSDETIGKIKHIINEKSMDDFDEKYDEYLFREIDRHMCG